jgi:hypothetical protein
VKVFYSVSGDVQGMQVGMEGGSWNLSNSS